MNANKRFWYVLFISVMILTGLWAGMAYSQSSDNYTIEWSVMDGGGGVRSSTNYTLSHSIGQTGGVIVSSSSQYTNHAGYYGKNARESVVARKTQETEIDRGGEPPGVFPDDTIHYSLTVMNLFDSAVYFMIQDALDAYVDYVAGTLYVNGIQESDDWFSEGLLDYESGLVGSGETLTIAFDVMVSDMASLHWIIGNTALVTAYTDLRSFVPVKTNTVKVEVVPEASTFLLLGIGLFGAFVFGRRKLKKK